MKLLTFQGYSDDMFACTGPRIDVDCDNCASGKPIRMLVQSVEGNMVVSGQYACDDTGGWLIGVAPWDHPKGDEEAIPNWPIAIMRSDWPYSPMLVITAPDDVTVELLP